ncbi:MAG: sugar ABC transporter ATP-binding protein [Dethiobacter sp.]|jgi:ribose transport system ATP-binding protein|nr:sugar ABC transporter ATP-binding protein [Dethiobacter sp.]
MPENDVLLELKGVVKKFPGVIALNNVDFTIKQGQTHVLVGENGAGKSTLVNIIIGAHIPDEINEMNFNGKTVAFRTPQDSFSAGIAAVQQHFSLIPDMTIAENIFLNREMRKGRITIDFNKMNLDAEKLIKDLGVELNPNSLVRSLSPGEQQIVEICKAISKNPKLLLMDEPTSGLKHGEIKRLFDIIGKLKDMGMTILYISHRLEEIFEIGDWVTCLRNGEKIADAPLNELDHQQITKLIIGQEMSNKFPKEEVAIGDIVLRVKNLQNQKSKVPIKDVSFDLKKGEILGVYGILGSGKDELAHTIFGADPATGGTVEIDACNCKINKPQDAIRNGIGYLTNDRRNDGLIFTMGVMQNQTLAALKRFCKFDYILPHDEQTESDLYIEKLKINTPGREFMVRNLSGGNQQKVVFSKWLISHAKILMFNEPTKGIDVGAKIEMFRIMVEEAKQGVGIIHFTSELDEVMGMADRILVMRSGEIVAEFQRGQVTKDELLRVATRKENIAV